MAENIIKTQSSSKIIRYANLARSYPGERNALFLTAH